MVFPVFYEASGTSARYHPCETARVEACRPRVCPSSRAWPRLQIALEDHDAAAGPGVDAVGAARESEVLGDAHRARVARRDHRHDVAQAERAPAPVEGRARRLGRDASAPGAARQAPADLDGG